MEIHQKNVRGVVKLFRQPKGYGFIVDDSGQDYFVHVNDVEHDETLSRGDLVVFDSTKADKGWRALSVRFKGKQAVEVPASTKGSGEENNQPGPSVPMDENGNVICPSCNNRVKPRVITSYRGTVIDPSIRHPHRAGVVPVYSACPACGSTIEKFHKTDGEAAFEKADDLAPMVGMVLGIMALFALAGTIFHQVFG